MRLVVGPNPMTNVLLRGDFEEIWTGVQCADRRRPSCQSQLERGVDRAFLQASAKPRPASTFTSDVWHPKL